MTKEQYLVFKSDLKASVASIKAVSKKFRKDYNNAGYNSLEDFNKAYDEAKKKSHEFSSMIKVVRKGYGDSVYPIANARDHAVHLAYYCAKHQLSESEIAEYLKNEVDRMKPSEFISKSYRYEGIKNQVRTILDAYEKTLCSD